MKTNFEGGKISTEQFQKILNAKGYQYSLQEAEKIRNWLYHFFGFTLKFIRGKTPEEINQIKKFLTEKVKLYGGNLNL